MAAKHSNRIEPVTWGSVVRDARRRMGYSQTELAELASNTSYPARFTQDTITRIERGERKVEASELRALEQALQCRLDTHDVPAASRIADLVNDLARTHAAFGQILGELRPLVVHAQEEGVGDGEH